MSITTSCTVGNPGSTRLSKQQWLEKSLLTLAAKGPSQISIAALTGALGVTKGSFYHHFADRADFVRSIVQYWDEKYTRDVASKPELQRGTPQERLWQLMLAIVESDLTRYDLAVRAWAGTDPDVGRLVAKADRFRLTFVRMLFSEMGFTDTDQETRTRTFVAAMSSEDAIYDRLPAAKRTKLLRAQHTFFTRPM